MLSLIPERPRLVHHIDMVKRRSVPLVVALSVLAPLAVTYGQSGASGVDIGVSTPKSVTNGDTHAGSHFDSRTHSDSHT